MIERMRKLSILLYHAAADSFLSKLQQAGVVHIETDKNATNSEIENLKMKINRLSKNAKYLLNIEKTNNIVVPQDNYNSTVDDLCNKIEEKIKQIDELKSKIASIEKEIAYLTNWGEFNPELIKNLENEGIYIKFYSTSTKKFNEYKEKYTVEKINEVKGTVYFVLIGKEDDEINDEYVNIEKFNLESINKLNQKKETLTKELNDIQKELISLCNYREFINKEILLLEDKLSYQTATTGLVSAAEGYIFAIKAWFPYRVEKQIKQLLDKEDLYYIISDPDKNDNVPVKLVNGPFARLFEPITRMYSLPSYIELDPTPFLAPFFALFFGLCMADVGYGLLLLIATLIALFVVKDKKMKPIIYLGIILSIMTIFGGYILNSFFGIQILKMPVPEWVKKGVFFGDIYAAMSFSIALGVLQVLLGYVMQVINKIRAGGIVAGLQPLGTFLMICSAILYGITNGIEGDFTIGPIPIKKILLTIPDPSKVSLILLVSGVLLILLFNNLKSKIYLRPLSGLWELYQMVTGIPGDILSYIRLFALGLAGGLLGNAFNELALMVKGDSIFGFIAMILILVVGHGMNIALASLGAFVHPLRLTLLEFYKAVGFTGGGLEYKPLSFKSSIKTN